MSRIRFEHTETPRDADARYGETVVSIMRDGVQIARVIVMADAGSEERGKPYLSIDVKPTDWRQWSGRYLTFEGTQSADRNHGKPYIVNRLDRGGNDGSLFYTIVSEPIS